MSPHPHRPDPAIAAAVRVAAGQLNAVVDAAHHRGLDAELRVLQLRDAAREDPPPMAYPAVSRRV